MTVNLKSKVNKQQILTNNYITYMSFPNVGTVILEKNQK